MPKLSDSIRAWRWIKRVFPNTLHRSEHDLAVNSTRLVNALQLAYMAGLKAGRREVNP